MTLVEIPSRQLAAKLLREGNFALWTDAHGNGQPFMANPKNAIFYPGTWLYLILPFFASFKLHFFLHVVITWLGIYTLLRSYELSQRASFLGACLFIFSGIYLSSFEFYNHIAALAWMPWVLFYLNKKTPTKVKQLLLTSLFWALLILAGAPEIIFITLMLALAQIFFEPDKWKKRLAATGLSLIVACFLSAVQILPSLELLADVDRQAQTRIWPLELIQLANVVFPHFLGNDRQPGHTDFWGAHLFDRNYPLYYSFYLGWGAIILVLIGLLAAKNRRQRVLIWTALFFFLIACGRYSPFFFLYRLLPVLNSIRYPVKFILGSFFCLSVLAAQGSEAMASAGEEKRKFRESNFPFYLLLVAAVMSGVYWTFKWKILSWLNLLFLIDKESSLQELSQSIETGLFLLGFYAVLLFIKEKSKFLERVVPAIILLAAIADPALHNRYVNPTVPYAFFKTPQLISLLGDSKTIFRDDFLPPTLAPGQASPEKLLSCLYQSLYPYAGIGEGVRYVLNKDFYATYSRRYHRLMKLIQELPHDARIKILEYLGCAYVITERPLFPSRPEIKREINGLTFWLQPLASKKMNPYLVFQTIEAESVEERVKIFASPSFDPLKAAIIPKGINPGLSRENLGRDKASIQVKKEIQGRAWYFIDTPEDAIIVIPGNFAPGWKAWIDKEPARVFEANLFSKGVFVPGGKHNIEIRYLPSSIIFGAVISLTSLAGLLIIMLCIFLKRRSKL